MPKKSRRSNRIAKESLGLLASILVMMPGCTYGPPEERATVAHLVRLDDSYRAVAVIQHDVFRRPTGLSAFPDGGRWRFLERRISEFLLDAESRRAVRLASHEATDSLWESFSAHIDGVQHDSVVYLRLTGCPRGGECYPDLTNRALFRISLRGAARRVNELPRDADLPSTMLGRAPGESNYVRFSTSSDTITALLDDRGRHQPMFVVRSNGSVEAVGG